MVYVEHMTEKLLEQPFLSDDAPLTITVTFRFIMSVDIPQTLNDELYPRSSNMSFLDLNIAAPLNRA